MIKINALRGTEDVFAQEAARWSWVEAQCRRVCEQFGYREVRTPLIEDAALFTRAVGHTTDIIQKEMYVLTDAGGRQVALRPEATASIARAYVQHEYAKRDGLVKWYYLGPMFRAERPQAGRRRQFHQVGVEAIGSAHPLIDAEVILLALDLLSTLGVTGTRTRINNVGCRADRARASARLRTALTPHRPRLCADCHVRLERNVFRVLDCKVAGCQTVIKQLGVDLAPCADCRDHHRRVLDALHEARDITIEEDPQLVRGLDYYTKTVFEFSHPALGAQDAVGAGGRYDNLVHDIGGPEAGACGFAIGLERLFMAMPAATEAVTTGHGPVALIALDVDSQREAFYILQELRAQHTPAVMDFESRSLKAQLRYANKCGARVAVIVGPDEQSESTVTVKDMQTGKQESVPMEQLSARLHAMHAA